MKTDLKVSAFFFKRFLHKEFKYRHKVNKRPFFYNLLGRTHFYIQDSIYTPEFFNFIFYFGLP